MGVWLPDCLFEINNFLGFPTSQPRPEAGEISFFAVFCPMDWAKNRKFLAPATL
jgi:hypothetical protein